MKIDHIHFLVEDAQRTCQWLVHTMGWKQICSEILPDRELRILDYRGSRFALSSPRNPTGPAARHLRMHGPGVVDVAIEVEDTERLLRRLGRLDDQQRRANPVPISSLCLRGRALPEACTWIHGWGSLGHSVLQRRPAEIREAGRGIDHIVLNVNAGELESAVAFYCRLLDIQPSQSFTISTDQSAMRSQVLGDARDDLYFNINEPCSSNSQIQQFIDFNAGPGIQHIALRSDPIVPTIAGLTGRGLATLEISERYYRQLEHRMKAHPAIPLQPGEWRELKQHNILIDWQLERPDALLLQAFSLPPFRGSQFFFELIERRRGADGFGRNNFQELYHAVEKEAHINN